MNKSRICPLCLKSQHPVAKCSLLRTTPRCHKCDFTHDRIMGCRPTSLKHRDRRKQPSGRTPNLVATDSAPRRAYRETLRHACSPPNKPSSNGTCEDLIDISSPLATVNAAHTPEQPSREVEDTSSLPKETQEQETSPPSIAHTPEQSARESTEMISSQPTALHTTPHYSSCCSAHLPPTQ